MGDSKTLSITTKGLLIPRYFVSQILGSDGRTRTVTESTVARWIDFKGDLSVRPDLGFWDRTAQGNKWRIEFVELDPGSQKYEETISHSSEFTIGIKLTDAFTKTFTGGFDASYKGVQSGSTKVTYNNDDDKLQESSVYFSDPIRQIYSTGLIQFTISAKDGNCGWNWSTNSGCDD